MKTDIVLKLAVQKSGRLSDRSLELIRECGISFQDHRGSSRLKSESSDFPLELLFLRDDDIPEYVADGVADLGIVGENVIAEQQEEGRILKRLGFGRCRLAVAVPKASPFNSLDDLRGRGIATTYPHIVSRYLAEHGVSMEIRAVSGSVEITPSIGLADAIADLVSTGSTLISNGLRELTTVMTSEAILIATKSLPERKEELLQQLLFRLDAVLAARNYKYILLNVPNEQIAAVSALLPGMKSPTVVPLAEPGWSSIHSVVAESQFWERIESLKQAGAQGILVLPIEKMIR
jgi:ATP phosphoribosyltransferase